MPPKFLIEHALSGRSICRGCNKPIEKDELRIGRLIPSPHHDGLLPLWQHVLCLFATTQVDLSWVQGVNKLTRRERDILAGLCTDADEQDKDDEDEEDVIVVRPPTRTMLRELAQHYRAAEHTAQADGNDAPLVALLAQLPPNQLPALVRLLRAPASASTSSS
jgi:hypothetical protein